MHYLHSEIFENYTKLALKQGLISQEQPAIKTAETKTRYDSQSMSDIELLYGLKNHLVDGKDILEQAHPTSVIIAPAHDKVNGLIENLKERHNIMMSIVNKPVNGLLTQHAYVTAHTELLNQLINVAFLLDRENQIQLMKLADSCSTRLVKVAHPLLLAALIAAGISSVYTVISQNLHLSQGVVQDADKALVELREAIDSYSEHPELKTELASLISKIEALKIAGGKVAAIQLYPASESSTNNAVAAYTTLQSGKDLEAIALMAGFASGCGDLEKILGDYVTVLKTKSQQYESTHSDWFEPLRRTYRSLIPSDLEDACGALEALQKSCAIAPAQMEAMIKLFRQLRAKGVESVESFKKKLEGSQLEPEKPGPSSPKPEGIQV